MFEPLNVFKWYLMYYMLLCLVNFTQSQLSIKFIFMCVIVELVSSYCRVIVELVSSYCRVSVELVSSYCRVSVQLLYSYCRVSVELL